MQLFTMLQPWILNEYKRIVTSEIIFNLLKAVNVWLKQNWISLFQEYHCNLCSGYKPSFRTLSLKFQLTKKPLLLWNSSD
jgi:hypothetical protein